MDIETIIQAISDPELIRRAIAALQEAPGPLELIHVGTDSTLSYAATYCIYHNCSKEYIIVSDFGPVENGAAMIYTMMLFGEFLAAKGILDSDIVPSSIVFTATTPDSSRDEYRLIRRRLIEPYIRTGRLHIERECSNAGGWYSIILEPDTDNLEDVVRDLEAEHGT